jgi:hypothetical protein
MVITTIFLSSCSIWDVKTVQAEKKGNYQKTAMFVTDSTKRGVITNVNTGRFCAEPPPETQSTFSGVFTALAEATKSAEEKAQIELSATIKKGFGQLYKRSHSNQMYRDISYSLCQAYVNGAFSDENLQTTINIAKLLTDDKRTHIKLDKVAKNAKKSRSPVNVSDEENSVNIPLQNNAYNAYLMVQMIVANMAFDSLQQEVTAFYNAETVINETKASIYEGKTVRDITNLQTAVGSNTAHIAVLQKTTGSNTANIALNNENIITINNSATAKVELKPQQ